MILLIDNNLPPVLAEILNPLASLDGHTVVHKRTAFGRTDIPDIEWIAEFGRKSDAAFLTCDTNILKKREEIEVFRQTAITGFWLKSKTWRKYLKNDHFHVLAGRLVLRWPQFVQAAELGSGQAYEVPVSGSKLRGL